MSVLFYKIEPLFTITCLTLFLIGFYADLKILKSAKLRLLFQSLILLLFLSLNQSITIDLRIDLLNKITCKIIFLIFLLYLFSF